MKATLVYVFALFISFYSKAGEASWKKYESGNFIVYSDNSTEICLKKIKEFERFRLALHLLLDIEESVNKVPFEIYLFKSRRELRKFTSRRSVAGYYRDRLGSPLMVVGPEGGNTIFFHEYVHFLTYRLGSFSYPWWYAEGMAEFYSTMEFKGGKAIVGGVPELRRDWLEHTRLTFLNELLEPGESLGGRKDVGRFYATSWLLTHRLLLGHVNGMKDLSEPFKEYLLRYTKGDGSADVFFELMQMTPKGMHNELRSYTTKKSFNALSLDAPYAVPDVEVISLSETAALNIKVRLALASDGAELAKKMLEKNAGLHDGESRAALAMLALSSSAPIDAEEKEIEALIEDQSLSGAAHVYLGQALFELAKRKAHNESALLSEAIRHLEEARSQGALFGKSDVMAEVYWELGRQKSAFEEIRRILTLNPASIEANLLAGEYSMLAGLKDDASYFLKKVINWAHKEKTRNEAQTLLDQLQDAERQPGEA